MRLTTTIREAFVRAAMQDVPKVDYGAQIEKLVADKAKEYFIKTTKLGADEYERLKNTGWLNSNSVYCGHGGHEFRYVYANSPNYVTAEQMGISVQALDELNGLEKAQGAARHALREKLKSVAASVTTRKALVDLLPEFEKYLPADTSGTTKNLPALANIVADFTKAGWPKGSSTQGA